MSAPLQSGSIGELFWRVDEAVVLVDGDRIIAWNPSAVRMFATTPDQGASADRVFSAVLGPAYDGLRTLLRQPGTAVIDATSACGLVLDVKSWPIEGSDVRMLIMTDVTAGRRLSDGLARLSALGRELLVSEPSLPDLLQQLADEAKFIARADFSTVLLLDPGSDVVTHFVYNAPRELFPEQLPRAVGLLALAIGERQPVCIADIAGHPAAVGLPENHPRIRSLLTAPVLAGDAIVGEIAVANTPTSRVFDDVDRELIVDLAAHAGIAVRWAEEREKAQRATEVRREIIATARHDIRNPLTIGKGYTAMLETRRDRLTPQQIESALAAVRVAFDRMEQFAARALMSEEDEAQADQPNWQRISVTDFLASLEADHNAIARESVVRVVTSADEAAPHAFSGDPGMVREVLDNLVTNAIKYGAAGGDVRVTARGEGDNVRFDVHNDGEGILPEDQQHIFDRYWRAKELRGGDIPGSGLGLAIVRRLVTLHGGVVGVSSRPEEGTTFWVTFPVAAPHGSA
ncbi:MAG: ATP-binding protein [Actinomycetes bacterium]